MKEGWLILRDSGMVIKMKILVIGGMGIIGGAVTEAAIKNGHNVSVLSRGPLRGIYKEMNIRNYQGDWKNDEFAESVLNDNFDIVVDSLVFNEGDILRDMNIVNGHCRQYIYISTDAVYNHPDKEVDENTKIDLSALKWGYGFHKRNAELVLLKKCKEYSFAWTVVRPTMTFGNNRIPVGFASRKNEWTLIDRIIRNKPILVFDNDSLHAMCHTTTFGQSVVDLFLNGNAYSEFFHVSDDNSIKYIDIYEIIFELLNRRCPIIHVNAEKLYRINLGKYEEMIYDKDPFFTLNNRKIKSISSNAEYNIELKKSIGLTINFLRENYSNKAPDMEYNLITDSILLSYNKLGLTKAEYEEARKYINSLPKLYLNQLRKYLFKAKIKSFVRPCYLKFRKFIVYR